MSTVETSNQIPVDLNQVEQLERAINELHCSLKYPNYGYCHSSVEDEISRQFAVKDRIKSILEQVPDNKLRSEIFDDQYTEVQELCAENQDVAEYLQLITSLEDVISQTSTQLTQQSLAVTWKECDNQFWIKDKANEVFSCWSTVERFSTLMGWHLRDASEYHKFFYTNRQMLQSLEDRQARISQFLAHRDSEDICEATVKDFNQLVNFIREQLAFFKQLCDKVDMLMRMARTIVPLDQRCSRVTDTDVRAVMLTDYQVRLMNTIQRFSFINSLLPLLIEINQFQESRFM
ncbi:hypothetical protein Ciccas_011745 [Cichlidogyrus casuarinus]|uniref:Uncharacterized protein n=1 Tax=Cichlidogyrus casuarinus TaxID=1844966 RepID=A0ABD2PRQ2_9PLAT